MSFRCPLATEAGHLKISPLHALLTSFKESSWSSSQEAQKWLDDEYQSKSIPVSKQDLGGITTVTDQILSFSSGDYHPLLQTTGSMKWGIAADMYASLGWDFLAINKKQSKRIKMDSLVFYTRQREKWEVGPLCVSMHSALLLLLLLY